MNLRFENNEARDLSDKMLQNCEKCGIMKKRNNGGY